MSAGLLPVTSWERQAQQQQQSQSQEGMDGSRFHAMADAPSSSSGGSGGNGDGNNTCSTSTSTSTNTSISSTSISSNNLPYRRHKSAPDGAFAGVVAQQPPGPQQQHLQHQLQHQHQPPPLPHQPRQYPPSQFYSPSVLSPSTTSNSSALNHVAPQPPPYSQQQKQQQQHHHHPPYAGINSISGAVMTALPAPTPTPAGHQAELNYIYGMVEELSRQLSDNRRVTEDIVSGLGRVRNRARTHALSNDDLIGSAADDINSAAQNLDAHVSILSEALEKASHSRDANSTLVAQYANTLALMLKQFHEYKAKHVADVSAWHRSYRAQLDEARRENSRLREQIWAMQTHAARANHSLRRFRRRFDDDATRWDRRAHDTAVRQQLRFWKRLAMPELDDDDPYWSADDDIIDSAEKARQRNLEIAAAREQLVDCPPDNDEEDDDDDDEDNAATSVSASDRPPSLSHLSMFGGTTMRREEPSGRNVPAPPPRPLSMASNTSSARR